MRGKAENHVIRDGNAEILVTGFAEHTNELRRDIYSFNRVDEVIYLFVTSGDKTLKIALSPESAEHLSEALLDIVPKVRASAIEYRKPSARSDSESIGELKAEA